MVGKPGPTGQNRLLQRDKGHALAGKSTLNHLELTPENAGPKNRYKKIVMNTEAIDALLVNTFIESYSEPPEKIILGTAGRKKDFSMATTPVVTWQTESRKNN